MQYILLHIAEGCDPVNKLYYCDLSKLPNALEGFRNGNSLLPFAKLIDNFDAQYEAIANDDTVFTFLTNKDAPSIPSSTSKILIESVNKGRDINKKK